MCHDSGAGNRFWAGIIPGGTNAARVSYIISSLLQGKTVMVEYYVIHWPRYMKRCVLENAFTGLYDCRCGTLNTIAPECIVQEGVAPAQDPVAVDVWGLGVTLYITLVGKFPFQVLFFLYSSCLQFLRARRPHMVGAALHTFLDCVQE